MPTGKRKTQRKISSFATVFDGGHTNKRKRGTHNEVGFGVAKARVSTSEFSWIAGRPPVSLSESPLSCQCRVRYRQSVEDCEVILTDDAPTHYIVRFRRPQHAVAPGQALVLYDGHICLGGGPIESRF